MALMNRERLLQKEELDVVKVEMADDEFVYVRQMTGRERDRFEQSLMEEVRDKRGNIEYKRSLEDFRAKLAVHTVCDEDGNNILAPEDYPTLSQNMSAFTLEKIINEAQKLNRITDEDAEALVKNLDGGQEEDTISDSPPS